MAEQIQNAAGCHTCLCEGHPHEEDAIMERCPCFDIWNYNDWLQYENVPHLHSPSELRKANQDKTLCPTV